MCLALDLLTKTPVRTSCLGTQSVPSFGRRKGAGRVLPNGTVLILATGSTVRSKSYLRYTCGENRCTAQVAGVRQADKSAVATVWKTKELKKRSWGYAKRERSRQFWKPYAVASGSPLST